MSWLNRRNAGNGPMLVGGSVSVSLPEILSALCFALDLTEDAVPGHALRTCLIGMHIAEELQLNTAQQCSLYFALLLKDVGCSSNSARMCQIIGGGDDRAVKAGAKLEDWTQPSRPSASALKLLWNNVTPGASTLSKGLRILKIGLTQHQNNEEMIALRCDRGAAIVGKIGLGPEAADAVRCLDEHWDGSGYPQGLKGNAIPLLARIACAAQHLDAFSSERGPEVAITTLNERMGRWFDPEIVRVANALHRSGRLWTGCWSPGHKLTLDTVKDIAPGQTQLLSAAHIDTICEAFAEVVDAKSPFTFSHSVGVTTLATGIAETMGMQKDRVRFIYRAALLHDLGKLRVPNSILDKNGKLNAEEWEIVREHPLLTRQILDRVQAFGDLAIIAGAHHEKLDGSGYPDRLRGVGVPLDARVLGVADVYSALVEDRPYRAGMTREDALALMAKDVPAKLDADCLDALRMCTTEKRTAIPAVDAEAVQGMEPVGPTVVAPGVRQRVRPRADERAAHSSVPL